MPLSDEALKLTSHVARHLDRCVECQANRNTEKGSNLPGQKAIHAVLEQLIAILFPGCHGHSPFSEQDIAKELSDRMTHTMRTLWEQIHHAFEYQCKIEECEHCGKCEEKTDSTIINVLNAITETKSMLQNDIVAAYEGDPAAKSTMEVVMSYPGVYAVIVHRIAHIFYANDVPLIPRIMSEHAHSRTGIDIHPGAQIGPGFFIDHGTGVVIGETSIIGSNVKLYQGVTLGAVSFEKDENGNPVKGIKRHPNIEDDVVIYAEATILGNITIGKGAEIGGNVWLTHSVPPGAKVYNHQPRPLVRQTDGSWRQSNGTLTDLGGGI